MLCRPRRNCLDSAPQSCALAAFHARNTVKPQERHNQKWQKIQQKVPPPEPWRSHFYLSCCFAIPLRTVNHKTHPPQLLPIKVGLSVIFRLSMRLHTLGFVKCFRQPSAHGLNAYPDLQIVGKRGPRRRFHKHIKSSGANVRMSPKSNYTRPNFLVLNNGKRRPVVRAGGRMQHQQEHNQKPNRNFLRTCRVILHPQRTKSGYPLISMTRISMG
jgi:hypothetical protein